MSPNGGNGRRRLIWDFIKEPGTKAKLSSSRLILFLWGLGVLVVWAITSIKAGTPQVLPDSVVTILGIVVGGKTVQRFGERAE